MNRLLWNEDGETLDEIVYHGYVHVEQMDDDHYWMGVGDSHFDFRAVKKGRLDLTGYDINPRDFPLEQRHLTQTEVDALGEITPENAHHTIRDDRDDRIGPVDPREQIRYFLATPGSTATQERLLEVYEAALARERDEVKHV